MSGPPKTPTNLKVLRGTFRADRALENEPQPELAIPPVPAHLSDESKVEWGRVSQELYQLGLLTNVDRAALCAYCDAWSDYVDASKQCRGQDGKDRKVLRPVDSEGKPTGGYYENPYYTIKKRSMEIMKSFLAEFGMTPASRTRISATPPDGAKQKPASRWSKHGS
jgi:P27 family predicted phage terminase small subunit